MALGFFSRLKEGLSRSSQKLSGGISAVFTKRKLDDEALEELEDLLISADLGTTLSRRIIGVFRRTRFGKEVTDQEIKQALAEEISETLKPVATPFTFTRISGPPSSRISTSGSPKTTNMLPRPVFFSSADMCMSGLMRAFRILRLPRLPSSEEWASKLKAQAISTSKRASTASRAAATMSCRPTVPYSGPIRIAARRSVPLFPWPFSPSMKVPATERRRRHRRVQTKTWAVLLR